MLLRKCKEKQIVCLHNILAEGAFVAQLSAKAEAQSDELCWVRRIFLP